MTRSKAIKILKDLLDCSYVDSFEPEENEALQMAISSLETDEAYQLEYERTTKNDLGVDCISRAEVIEEINSVANDAWDEEQMRVDLIAEINALPSVTPQEPKCKNCKWWKDSDGEYRRGCGAESQCPINRREVFEGNGYCYLFEPQESEE